MLITETNYAFNRPWFVLRAVTDGNLVTEEALATPEFPLGSMIYRILGAGYCSPNNPCYDPRIPGSQWQKPFILTEPEQRMDPDRIAKVYQMRLRTAMAEINVGILDEWLKDNNIEDLVE